MPFQTAGRSQDHFHGEAWRVVILRAAVQQNHRVELWAAGMKCAVVVAWNLPIVDVVPGFDYVLGSVFHVGLFNQGDFVRVSGTSKGRGFAGVIKRHNFSRQKKTHGTGHTERAPGSIGQASDPSRVFPGMRMAGRHGNAKVTVENLEVVGVDRENNHLIVKGSIPGPKGSIVTVEK